MPANTTNFREGNVDISGKYVSVNEAEAIDPSFFTDQGLIDISKGLWSWGAGSSILGQNSLTRVTSPTQVGTLKNWKQISSGLNNCAAIRTDGTLWTWGTNGSGQLGLGDVTSRSSPTQVGALTNWSKVSFGDSSCLAIKTDGTLWAWGSNGRGQLGLGDIISRSSPVQVGALTNWAEISIAKNIEPSCLAVKTDGTLWSWGEGQTGSLGLGDTLDRSSPVQVGLLTDWIKVSVGESVHCLAVRANGTLWVWGDNNLGQLGLLDITSRSSPTQVTQLSSLFCTEIHAGSFNSFAIVKDSINQPYLYSWGQNNVGQLGQGDRTHRSQPQTVGTSNTWKTISSFNQGTLATRTDGTLWAWGRVFFAGTFLDSAQRSSPVQVTSGTNWARTSGGETQNFAVRL